MPNIKTLALIAVVAALGVGLYFWWQHEKIYPSTDDAYLQSNVLTAAAQISGRIADVKVAENSFVKQGDVLFEIDTASLKAAVDAAKAEFDIATQDAGASGANVQSAEAVVARAEAQLVNMQAEFERTDKLFKDGDVAQAALDKATAERDQAAANKKAAEAALTAARDQLGATGKDNAGVRAALGALTQAQINLGHATVTAPTDGWVANLTLRPGQVVAANQALFSIVEDGDWWVSANFKETDLSRIRPGQPTLVSIDMYPGVTVKGVVESIGAGSGAVFSLLPPENATGNWVKVTQRFPVRIKLSEEPVDKSVQLRIGASVTAKVDTSQLGGS